MGVGRRVEGRAERQQAPCRSGGEIHGQPHHLVAGEGQLALVRHREPAEPGDLSGQPVRGRTRRGRAAEVEDHSGAALEEPGLRVEA